MNLLNVNILEVFKSWWRGDVPTGGILMAVGMAILRMRYSGAPKGKTIMEGLLCGALTLTAVSAMSFFNVPKNMTVSIGGFIGFIGVKKISALLSKYISRKGGR
ncbi:phage holin, lambda family [Klebsiella quasipneumoniae]|uniref:phage holin, lambda family n=1 Tax=Klebsiella quasipneumoniae TaxID=1463165 RepID=UPI001365BF26|nr:phage holin, lambda family [Klebsiella quasipneumoniae]MDH8372460.1 phage holin, lambda family [Klebsiella pneumoniae]NBZ45954.1 phage holin, lambda family [Klebsiella quasipneumoniae]HBT5059929.1 phage holin, lambda family [Klebsiella pneumoniae]HBT5087526.1 phage holin, lambda family [Klebsiella pneumoniae]